MHERASGSAPATGAQRPPRALTSGGSQGKREKTEYTKKQGWKAK